MSKKAYILVLVSLVLLFGAGCGGKGENVAGTLKTIDDIADKRVGVYTGTVFDAFVREHYPEAEIVHCNGTADMILALKGGKIDVATYDYTSAKVIINNNDDIGLLTDNAMSLPLGVGFNKNNPALRVRFNDFLKEIRSNGTYDEMYDRWFENDPEQAVIPDGPNPGTGQKLTPAVAVADLPYVAYINGQYTGFDIELVKRFAAHEGRSLEIQTMEFSTLIAALASGKADMIADGIAITEERSKQVDFSDSYVDFKTAVIALKKKPCRLRHGTTERRNGSPILTKGCR